MREYCSVRFCPTCSVEARRLEDIISLIDKKKFKKYIIGYLGKDHTRYTTKLMVRFNYHRMSSCPYTSLGLIKMNLSTAIARCKLRIARRKIKFMQFMYNVIPSSVPTDILRIIFSYYTYS